MKVKFKEWNCVAVPGRYAHLNRPAISLVSDDEMREPIATATVNLDNDVLPKNCVHIKEYSENAGMIDALEEAGIVDRLASFDCGYPGTTVWLARLTDAGKQMFDDAEG